MVKNLSFSSVEKLKDFVDKSGRLPDNISKKNLCKDIVRLLGSNVSAPQKNQVSNNVHGCCAGSYGNAETHLIGSLRYYLHNVNFVYFVDLDSPKKNVA